MTKNLIKSIAIALVFVPMVVLAETPAPTPASTPVSDSASTAGPATSNSSATVANAPAGGSSSTTGPSTGNSSATVSNPSTGSSGSTAGPSTGGSSSTASDTILPTPTPTATPTPVTPPNNGGNGGNGSGGGSSSGSSSSSGSRVAYPYACNQFTTFMRYGYNNDKNQVIRLQTFLREAEKMNITINGIFDKQTENAVIAFQNKYSGTVMGPWGASQGSGYVYITTIKQINKIACSIPLSLNPQELAIINNYKNRRNTSSAVIVTPKNESAVVNIEVKNNENTITLTSTEESNTENLAAASKPSIMDRFWNFLVYLFK